MFFSFNKSAPTIQIDECKVIDDTVSLSGMASNILSFGSSLCEVMKVWKPSFKGSHQLFEIDFRISNGFPLGSAKFEITNQSLIAIAHFFVKDKKKFFIKVLDK